MTWDVVSLAGLIGTVAFAFSGFLVGARKRLDIVGIFILCMVTANGGGALRDVLVNRVPLVLQDSTPFLISFGVMLLGWALCLHNKESIENHKLFVLSDAIGLVAFSVTGAMVGIEYDLPLFGVMVLAFLTATGGGIIRDIFVGEIPVILNSDFYGSVALLIALALFGLHTAEKLTEVNIGIVLGAALVLRLIAYSRNWQVPRLKLRDK